MPRPIFPDLRATFAQPLRIVRGLRRRISRTIAVRLNPPPAARLAPPSVTVTRSAPANAYSINDVTMPRRRRSDGKAIAPLLDFVAWANVEDPEHCRWWPAEGRTYCNIYAHDYCDAAGVYLPRVWWNRDALENLRHRRPVDPVSGETVYEMDANGLHDWLARWGRGFGWKPVPSMDQLQDAANAGAVALIVARNKDWHAPGHITLVLPETATHTASRSEGRVVLPLQSEAGAVPLTCGHDPGEWWLAPRFETFRLYRNDRLAGR